MSLKVSMCLAHFLGIGLKAVLEDRADKYFQVAISVYDE